MICTQNEKLSKVQHADQEINITSTLCLVPATILHPSPTQPHLHYISFDIFELNIES